MGKRGPAERKEINATDRGSKGRGWRNYNNTPDPKAREAWERVMAMEEERSKAKLRDAVAHPDIKARWAERLTDRGALVWVGDDAWMRDAGAAAQYDPSHGPCPGCENTELDENRMCSVCMASGARPTRWPQQVESPLAKWMDRFRLRRKERAKKLAGGVGEVAAKVA